MRHKKKKEFLSLLEIIRIPLFHSWRLAHHFSDNERKILGDMISEEIYAFGHFEGLSDGASQIKI